MLDLLKKLPRWAWWTLGGVVVTGVIPLWAFAYKAGQNVGLIFLRQVDGKPLSWDTASKYIAMRDAAAADGITLKLNSGFRTMAEQTILWLKSFLPGEPTAAKPGYSNHQGGTAVDIEVHRTTTSPEYQWLEANAVDYGFVNTGANFHPPEFWHFEVVS